MVSRLQQISSIWQLRDQKTLGYIGLYLHCLFLLFLLLFTIFGQQNMHRFALTHRSIRSNLFSLVLSLLFIVFLAARIDFSSLMIQYISIFNLKMIRDNLKALRLCKQLIPKYFISFPRCQFLFPFHSFNIIIINSIRLDYQLLPQQIIYLQYFQMIKIFTFVFMMIILITALPPQNPVIGIYTQATASNILGQDVLGFMGASNHSFIAASYVKYIQMSGAQVVPIFAYTKNASYFDNLLPKLNGVLFPGGAVSIDINNLWTKNADYILKYAISENKKGNMFAVWGTCLGWQLLAYLTSGYDKKVISAVRGQDAVINRISIKTPNYLYNGLSANIQNKLQNGEGIVYFHHSFAVTPASHQNNAQLKAFWNIASTTTTSYNQIFISTAEAKNYPIYGIQFHPEKNLYEWGVKADRSYEGAMIAQILSNKFLMKARQSANKFRSAQQYQQMSINNYKAIVPKAGYTQTYIFDEPNVASQNDDKHLLSQ